MKTNKFVIIGLMLVSILSGCKKDQNLNQEPVITETPPQTHVTQIIFEWTVDYPGKIGSMLEFSQNEDMSDATLYGSEAVTSYKDYYVRITGLLEGVTYYYRFLVWNPHMEYKTEVQSISTKQYQLPTVTTSNVTNVTGNSALCEGTVTYDEDSGLLEKGICWGTEHNPTIEGLHLSCEVDESFTIDLTGLTERTMYYVRAYATNIKGTAYGDEISFYTLNPSPEGTVNGLFTVRPDQQVYFSKSNLQFRSVDWFSPYNYYFILADHQYDIVGVGNTNIGINCENNIDLFGWATSKYTDPNAPDRYSVPYETAYGAGHDNNYGPGENDLTGTYNEYDWGYYNAIKSGGNAVHLWRTLTIDEWLYVINTREASTVNGIENARYAKGCVNGVYGTILFPDQYPHPEQLAPPCGINSEDATGWMANSYSLDDWKLMEQVGAVFLPVTGYRKGTEIYSSQQGLYWSTTHDETDKAFLFVFDEETIGPNYALNRGYGCAVRLVMNL